MIGQALAFLLDAVASFFCSLFLLRFFMQAFRASFAGPFGHFVVTLTNWAVRPLRKIIPGLFGLDLASLLAAFFLQCLLMVALLGLSGHWLQADGASIAFFVLGGALRGLIRLALYLVIGVLILQAVLSWVNPYSPLAGPVNQITRPVLGPIRRILPPISGIDLSPLVAILIAQLVLMFV